MSRRDDNTRPHVLETTSKSEILQFQKITIPKGPKILQSLNIREIMLLYKNLTTNKELSDFYGLGIFFF